MIRKFFLVCLLATGFLGAQEVECETNYLPPQHKPRLMLYYSATCPYSQKVLDYLTNIQKTVPMKNVYLDAQAKEELRHLGGRMIVPCLIIDGKPLYDADDIIQWLADNKELY